MFEHLTNDAEVFRNNVIDTNNKLSNISERYINSPLFYLNEDEFKIKKMKEFLEQQDNLNKLYLNKM